MNKTNFGINLEHYLKLLGLSQRDLSEKTGLTQAAISQFINGKREPNLNSICQILKVIPIKFETLVQTPKITDKTENIGEPHETQ